MSPASVRQPDRAPLVTPSVVAPVRHRCFKPVRWALPSPVRSSLADRAAEALADLLPVLGCGEEAAALAFDNLADAAVPDMAGTVALRQIADEEHVHDALIHSIAAALPPPSDPAPLRARSRRFHLELGRGDPTSRLARIAALDSAVCLILSRLLRRGTPLADDPVVAGILRRIARDEARHVRTTRRLAGERASEAELLHIGAPVREALASLLEQAGDAFEALAFDPSWLRRDVARLPAGLYRR